MKNSLLLPTSSLLIVVSAALALALAISSTQAQRPAAQPLPVAILDFAASGDMEGQGSDAAALLNGLLSVEENFYLVERAELDKILSETELSLSGTVSADSAAAVGQLTGAKVLISGRLFNAGETNYAVAKVISTETGRVFGATAKFGKSESFASGVEALAKQVKIVLTKKSRDLVVAVETPEARIKRLKAMIGGKKLPSVFVKIPETHLSRSIPDPAAETEIQKTLQELGFILIDNSNDADVSITGEAFSELAGRRGSLVSCRARVELKIQKAATPGKIKVERQTSVAIDLAENVAAKSALQNAGAKVCERLIPLLVK